MEKPKIDTAVLGITIMLVLAVCAPMGYMPEQAAEGVSKLQKWMSEYLGIFYQYFTVVIIGYLAWLTLSRYGDIRLSKNSEPPEYSDFAWAGMLFCAGTGASLLVWSGVEWVEYYIAPPFGIEPRSTQAMEIASAYGPFHWGVVAWCFYALPTIAIAYAFYIKGVPYLRPSTGLHAILGKAGVNSVAGRTVDLLSMIALLGGAATSLGMITPMTAACIAKLFGIETSFGLQLGVISLCIALVAISVYLGIDRGIKRLSEFNVILIVGILAFILIVGPTLFILKNSLNTIGVMVSNVFRMVAWTNPLSDGSSVESWTIFYWAWWISFAPAIGVFVTRISKGRTIRQVVFNMLLYGSLGSSLFYFVIGNYSISLEIDQVFSVIQSVEDNGIYGTTASIISTLPYSTAVISLFTIVSIISVSTTYDSASYTLASTATKYLTVGSSPAKWHSLFWTAILGTVPIFMIFVGGIEVIQSGVLIVSFPLLFVLLAMAYALKKSLQ